MGVQLQFGGQGGSGGGSNVSTFSDNFTRANANTWGANWNTGYITTNNGTAYSILTINSNLGRYAQSASAGNCQMGAYPRALAWFANSPKSHYSQVVVSARSVATASTYVCTVFDPNMMANVASSGAYAVRMIHSTGNVDIIKLVWNNNLNLGPTLTTLAAAVTTFSLGDTLRMEATISGSTWTLVTKKNSVQVDSRTDTSLTLGVPALVQDSAGSGNTYDYSSYAAGAL